MGKSSKNKSKKLAKQERVAHLKHVKECENSFSLLYQRIASLDCGMDREACVAYNQQLQLTLRSRKAYMALCKHEDFRHRLSASYAGLLAHQIQCQNYIEAFDTLTNFLKIPRLESLLNKSVEPLKDLFLLRLEVEILQKIKEVSQRNKHFNLVGLGKMFFVYSSIDNLRHALVEVGEEDMPSMLDTVQTLISNRTLFDLLNGTGHLAASLHSFYRILCGKEELPPEKADTVMADCIKMMEVYLNCKSSSLNMFCYTCNDKDTNGYEVFVCQGCRVACYCCKDHQRLNYLHHEDTGTRGLGHKSLCPVFKTYRKMKDNTDSSKDGHLERKFQRACKRFFYIALNSIGNRKIALEIEVTKDFLKK